MNIKGNVRRPAVAGRFYPAESDALRQLVVGLLGDVPHEERRCSGAIAPHAGLEYSGSCAAAVFGRIRIPPTVVVLAPNHTGLCESPGASLWPRGAFRTPLGDAPVDEAFAARLEATCELVAEDHFAHAEEHAIEVELPFLQVRSPSVTIVPIVLAFTDWERCEVLGRALAETTVAETADVLLLASSDFSHNESAASAYGKDHLALKAIERLDAEVFLQVCNSQDISTCGRAPVACVLEASRALGARGGKVLDYRHSGMVTGDESSVVAYAGVILS